MKVLVFSKATHFSPKLIELDSPPRKIVVVRPVKLHPTGRLAAKYRELPGQMRNIVQTIRQLDKTAPAQAAC